MPSISHILTVQNLTDTQIDELDVIPLSYLNLVANLPPCGTNAALFSFFVRLKQNYT